MRRQTVLLVAVFSTICGNALAADHTKDTLQQVRKNLDAMKAVLIDVREKDEWDKGHLKDASLVPLSELSDAAQGGKGPKEFGKKLPKDTIIYCH